MIGLNPLRTKVLITTDEVVFHAPMQSDMDPREILQSIVVAERRFIKPMLGATLYQTLLDAKNTVVDETNKDDLQTKINDGRGDDREPIELNDGDMVSDDSGFDTDQLTLWQDYLHKIVAECVWFVALPVNRARFTSKGVELNNPQSIAASQPSASISLGDLKHLMDRGLQDRISPLMEDMHGYLCKTKFAGYTKNCGCDTDGRAYRKKGDILFGLYGHRHDNCGCDENRDELGERRDWGDNRSW